MHAAAAGSEEMAQFVDEDRPAKKEDDQEDRPGVGEQGLKEIGRHGGRNLTAMDANGRELPIYFTVGNRGNGERVGQISVLSVPSC
jgi:hypothetical protein